MVVPSSVLMHHEDMIHRTIYLAVVAWILGLAVMASAQTTASNVIKNGDFERWEAFVPAASHKIHPNVPGGLSPVDWRFYADALKSPENSASSAKVSIFRDDQVVHGGKYSVRIENGNGTDIGLVNTPMFEGKPDQTYKLRVWYKGQDIKVGAAQGAGICFYVNQGPTKFWSEPTIKPVVPKTRVGTFDWRKIEIVFKTKPNTTTLFLGLQLRGATGQAWFDDVELIEVPPGEEQTK